MYLRPIKLLVAVNFLFLLVPKISMAFPYNCTQVRNWFNSEALCLKEGSNIRFGVRGGYQLSGGSPHFYHIVLNIWGLPYVVRDDRLADGSQIFSDGTTSFTSPRGYAVQTWKNNEDSLVGSLELEDGTLLKDFQCAFCPNLDRP